MFLFFYYPDIPKFVYFKNFYAIEQMTIYPTIILCQCLGFFYMSRPFYTEHSRNIIWQIAHIKYSFVQPH